jgi:hypothetical protein
MRKLSLVLVALVAMALAPAAMACAFCDGENCQWDTLDSNYFALECWYEWCPPCGCYTTGHCHPGFAALTTDLAQEYRIASVEIRQGDVLVAHKVEESPAVVAEKKVVLR